MGWTAWAIGGLVAILCGLAAYYALKSSRTSKNPTTSIVDATAPASSSLTTVTAKPAAVSTTPTAPTATPIGSVTFYAGAGAQGASATVSTIAQMTATSFAPASATVANGGSFGFTVTWPDGTVVNWSMAAGQQGSTDAPAGLVSKGGQTPQTVVLSLNGQSQTVTPPQPTPTASFCFATGTCSVVSSLDQLMGLTQMPVSATVSSGASFSIAVTLADGSQTTWSMSPGQTGTSSAPAALTSIGPSGPPKSATFTFNGQSQTTTPALAAAQSQSMAVAASPGVPVGYGTPQPTTPQTLVLASNVSQAAQAALTPAQLTAATVSR